MSAEIISDNIRVAQQHGNAVTAIPCAEAIGYAAEPEDKELILEG